MNGVYSVLTWVGISVTCRP